MPFEKVTPAQWQRFVGVNMNGPYFMCHSALPHLRRAKRATIVNFASTSFLVPYPGMAHYAASKGAVNAFTRASATEFSRFGVRVNAVLPGWTPTGLLGSLLDQERGRNIKRQLPLRDFATAEQVAAAVAFLASDDAAYTTGELLHVDGGWTAQLGLGRPKTEGGR